MIFNTDNEFTVSINFLATKKNEPNNKNISLPKIVKARYS